MSHAAIPPLADCLQPLADGGWRYAQVVCDFYLRTSIEFHLDDPPVSLIAAVEEGLPIQPGADEIDDWPATSPIAEDAIEILGILANFRQADVGANTFSRHACFRHGVEAC